VTKEAPGDEYSVTVNPPTAAPKKATIVKAIPKGGSEAQGSPARRETLSRSN
jgi:hypothetical protein